MRIAKYTAFLAVASFSSVASAQAPVADAFRKVGEERLVRRHSPADVQARRFRHPDRSASTTVAPQPS